MEEYQYQDPVTSFLKELYVEFDFGAASRKLLMWWSDTIFFGEFKDGNGRYLISEAYCRIHQKTDIG